MNTRKNYDSWKVEYLCELLQENVDRHSSQTYFYSLLLFEILDEILSDQKLKNIRVNDQFIKLFKSCADDMRTTYGYDFDRLKAERSESIHIKEFIKNLETNGYLWPQKMVV